MVTMDSSRMPAMRRDVRDSCTVCIPPIVTCHSGRSPVVERSAGLHVEMDGVDERARPGLLLPLAGQHLEYLIAVRSHLNTQPVRDVPPEVAGQAIALEVLVPDRVARRRLHRGLARVVVL